MSPYDWLFDFKELETIINRLLPVKDIPILLIGAGNAPFSADLYDGGYRNLTNTNISSVVIEQQKAKFPEQKWLLEDVMCMSFKDGAIVLIDKSLLDTVLCYSDSVNQTHNMLDEVYRVLGPGSRYITFSLHSPTENLRYFADSKYDWAVSAFRIKSSRWNTGESRRRAAVAYTMCICDRPNKDGSFNPGAQHPLPMPEALSEEEYNSLSSQANEFNFQCAMNAATVDQLVDILEKVLAPPTQDLDEEGQGQGVVVGSDCDGNINYDEEHGEEKG